MISPSNVLGLSERIADMITVFGEGRGFRVVWLLEEMGLPYRLRDVDLLAGVESGHRRRVQRRRC